MKPYLIRVEGWLRALYLIPCFPSLRSDPVMSCYFVTNNVHDQSYRLLYEIFNIKRQFLTINK